MRFTIQALLITATIASSPVVAEPTVALTADEKREKSRLLKAKGVSLKRESAARRFTYAEKCEAAFAKGEPMPEVDFFIKEEIGIDDDLVTLTTEQILEESARASDEKRASEKAWKACVLKFRKRDEGS